MLCFHYLFHVPVLPKADLTFCWYYHFRIFLMFFLVLLKTILLSLGKNKLSHVHKSEKIDERETCSEFTLFLSKIWNNRWYPIKLTRYPSSIVWSFPNWSFYKQSHSIAFDSSWKLSTFIIHKYWRNVSCITC